MTTKDIKIPFPEFHPKVNDVSKSLYESGHYTDALRRASIRLEETCKQIYKDKTGNEESGTTLMSKLFCEKDGKVVMPMVNLLTKEGSDRQKSIYFLFSGCIGAIRNPISHESGDLDDYEALYALNIISYLFHKLDIAIGKEVKRVQHKEISSKKPVKVSKEIEKQLLELFLEDEEIKSIPKKTEDRENAKLLLDKWIERIFIDNLSEENYEMINAFNENSDLQEKIYEIILEKIYV